MKPLPLPVRITAGLVAIAVEQARDLPRLVIEFPVTAVSQALQLSMRVQQKVTELAIKGDRALGTLRPVEEKPSWATFDEDEAPRRNGASTVTELRPPLLPSSTAPEPESRDNGAARVAAKATAARAAADVKGADSVIGPRDDDASGPNLLPEYRAMTIPQLRGKLRRLSVEDLRALLEWEIAHDDRPPFVTMLTNRITTVTEG